MSLGNSVWFCALTNKADVYFMMNGARPWNNAGQKSHKLCANIVLVLVYLGIWLAWMVIDFQPTQPTHEATQAQVPSMCTYLGITI